MMTTNYDPTKDESLGEGGESTGLDGSFILSPRRYPVASIITLSTFELGSCSSIATHALATASGVRNLDVSGFAPSAVYPRALSSHQAVATPAGQTRPHLTCW
jgi:hypothetical protein